MRTAAAGVSHIVWHFHLLTCHVHASMTLQIIVFTSFPGVYDSWMMSVCLLHQDTINIRLKSDGNVLEYGHLRWSRESVISVSQTITAVVAPSSIKINTYHLDLRFRFPRFIKLISRIPSSLTKIRLLANFRRKTFLFGNRSSLSSSI